MKNKELFEKRLTEVTDALRTGDYSIAPSPLLGFEARLYLQGEHDTLIWVLEMSE